MAGFKFQRAPQVRGGDQYQASCERHGQYRAELVEQFDGSWKARTCWSCRHEALNWEDVDEAVRAQAKAEDRALRVNALLVGSGITPRFRGASFLNYRTDGDARMGDVLGKCRVYAEQFPERAAAGQSLLLLGNLGTGKTHLGSAIVQHVIREFLASAVIISAAEIARAVRASYAKGSDLSEMDLLAELADLDLLVIDEVGVQSGSDFAPGLMHEVIDRRYQTVRPTIVISNQTVEALPRFLGDRAVDRLREGSGRLLSFPWASARGEA